MTTALIAISREPAVVISFRNNASFAAHLIATAAQMPQTRARRRAEPAAASAAYRALGQWPSDTGGILSQSL